MKLGTIKNRLLSDKKTEWTKLANMPSNSSISKYKPRYHPKPFLFLFAFVLVQMFLATPAYSQANDPVVELKTTKGNIYIRVFRGLVPRTSTNFLDLVDRGFYNGTVFHRIENWCVQGGSPNGDVNANFIDPQSGRPRFIPLEINRRLSHSGAGMVAMARTNNPHSASCQFYILKSPMRQLDGQYAIFGKVLQGINAVQNMRRGDRIVSARIVQTTQRSAPPNNPSNSSARRRSSPGHQGPTEQFEPPADIPDSGF